MSDVELHESVKIMKDQEDMHCKANKMAHDSVVRMLNLGERGK